MASFFHENSEIQTAASSDHHVMQQQNLCLMNPTSPLPYSLLDPPSNTNNTSPKTTRFFSSSAASVHNLSHAPPLDHQHFVGLPLPAATTMMGPTTSITTQQYANFWAGPENNQTLNILDPGSAGGGAHRFKLSRWGSPPASAVSPGNGKKLCLSLSSQHRQQMPYRSSNDNADHLENNMQGNSLQSAVSNGVVSGVMQNGDGLWSKYLKAAQELLDEIVRVGDNLMDGSKKKLEMKKELAGEGSSKTSGGNEPVAGLTAAHRQELQMKKAKLLSMIEEVEQRYKQYRSQMQTIVSSLEQAAGFGSAKPYTSLALQTISKQFRSLKDTISSETKSISKILGEDDCIGAKGESSRLRFADHQLRHLGFIQHHHHHHNNAWRPQRGLPERAVSILRAWLFEHFLHPYPRDSDKHILAKQTGLTRSQVSNWFINARVRLWKPMVEEMYLEEMKEQEGKSCDRRKINQQDNENEGSSSRSTTDPKPHRSNIYVGNSSTTDQCSSSIMSANCLTGGGGGGGAGGGSIRHENGFNLIEMDQSVVDGSYVSHRKHLRSDENNNNTMGMQNSTSSIVSFDVEMKQQGDTQREMNLSNYIGGFGNYHAVGDIGRFFGNGVSLSLGLPRCDNNNNNNNINNNNNNNSSAHHSLSETQHSFHSNQTLKDIQFGTDQIEFFGISTAETYQNIDVQNKKRFASAPLLPDFFA